MSGPGRLVELISAASAGYLAGTIPSADLAARRATGGQVDLRNAGSGNPGGANAGAVLGTRWGYAVMAADIAKGAAACRVGGRLAGASGAHLAGTAAVVGHCFPLWNGFHGGKGVACSAGQCLATFPAYFPLDVAVAAVTATGPWRRRAFAATTAASITWVLAGLLWWRRQLPNAWGPKLGPQLPLAAAATSAVVLSRFVVARRP
jgi:glycerol-3-phosphate acyltransferase PlsY